MRLRKTVREGITLFLLVGLCVSGTTVCFADNETGGDNDLKPVDELLESDKEPDVNDEDEFNEKENLDNSNDLIPVAIEPKISYSDFTDSTQKQYEIEVSDCDVAAGGVVRAAVWSAAGGQDDIIWNTMTQKTDRTYELTFPLSDYRSSGKFFIHIYVFSADAAPECILTSSFQVESVSTAKIEIENLEYDRGQATVKISDFDTPPSGISGVQVAVWSDSQQKDICWYTASREGDEWYANMNLSMHNNNWGLYHIHVYATDGNGFCNYVGDSSVDFSLRSVKTSLALDEKKAALSFELSELVMPGADDENVLCAVWSAEGGQDDLRWYSVGRSGSNSTWTADIPLSNLSHTGTVIADTYVNHNGISIPLARNTIEVPGLEVDEVTIDTDNGKGAFSVIIKGLEKTKVTKVEVPVWSSNNAQDDIVWYEAKLQSDGTYKFESNISNHKYDIGKYHAHIYVTDKYGIRSCLATETFTFTSSVGEIQLSNDEAETLYKVSVPVEEYPCGLTKVMFAVWSEAGGQDDIVWYTANESDNTYYATIDIKNHATAGQYYIHAYGVAQNGAMAFLGLNNDLAVTGKSTGTVSVENVNSANGTFDVKVSELAAPSGISGVRVAIWSKPDQSDIVWYTCSRQNDTTFVANVNVANHAYNLGTYNMHVYTVMGNQIMDYTTCTSYNFNPSNFVYINKPEHGKRTVTIKNPSSEQNVRFAVWSDANGQDDIIWYTASKVADKTWQATIVARNHKNAGLFNVHGYADTATGLGIKTFDFPANEFAKNGWYYETINGRTYKLYYVNDVLQTDISGIIGPQSSYKAEINRTTCTVTIYANDGANGYIIPVKAFTCSVGLPGTPTPTGTYHTLAKYRWAELMGPSYGQYCTRIVGGILFHSVAGSNTTSYNLSAAAYNMLGQPASHGCVRLCVRDAKWIYDNCALGMEVRIYDSAYPGPFGKPATIKIPAGQTWDPTDPNV